MIFTNVYLDTVGSGKKNFRDSNQISRGAPHEDVAKRGVDSIGVRSSGNLCVEEGMCRGGRARGLLSTHILT